MKNFAMYNIYPPLVNAVYPRCEIITTRFNWDPGAGNIMILINSSIIKVVGEKTHMVSPTRIDKTISISYSAYFSTRLVSALDVDVKCLGGSVDSPPSNSPEDKFKACKGTGFTKDQCNYIVYSHGGCSRDDNIGTRIHFDIFGNLGAKKRETIEKKLLCGPYEPSQWWDYTSNPCKWCCDRDYNVILPKYYSNDGDNIEYSLCPDFNAYSTYRPIYEEYSLNHRAEKTNLNIKELMTTYATKNNVDLLIVKE